MAFKIDLGAVMTNVLSVSIFSIIVLVGRQVYVGSTETTARTAASVEVIVTELVKLQEMVEALHSASNTVGYAVPRKPKSTAKRVTEALTFAPLWKQEPEPVPAAALDVNAVPAAELEKDIWQQIDDKARNKQ